MESKAAGSHLLRLSKIMLLGGAVMVPAVLPADAAPKDKVTISVVQALAAGEWSTEIIAGANAAAKPSWKPSRMPSWSST
jgi:ABC-type sugar transport system substrate-binding protein